MYQSLYFDFPLCSIKTKHHKIELTRNLLISVPLEMKILRREHFNRWYKLTPYLLSMLLMEIPFQVSNFINPWKSFYPFIKFNFIKNLFEKRIYINFLIVSVIVCLVLHWHYLLVNESTVWFSYILLYNILYVVYVMRSSMGLFNWSIDTHQGNYAFDFINIYSMLHLLSKINIFTFEFRVN